MTAQMWQRKGEELWREALGPLTAGRSTPSWLGEHMAGVRQASAAAVRLVAVAAEMDHDALKQEVSRARRWRRRSG
jgi:hypothetical protein